MEPLHYLTLAGQDLSGARSALPDAPVAEWTPRPQRARVVRRSIAHSLHRLGDAVAPAPVNCADPIAV